jgi:hypothetical protein
MFGLTFFFNELIESIKLLSLGGVILIGGQTNNQVLATLYELKDLSKSWMKMLLHLETPRRFHIALKLSHEIISECSSGIKLLLVDCFDQTSCTRISFP